MTTVHDYTLNFKLGSEMYPTSYVDLMESPVANSGPVSQSYLYAAVLKIINVTQGRLYRNNLYTYAFSRWALRRALPLLYDPIKYRDTDPKQFMFQLEQSEPISQKEGRAPKRSGFKAVFNMPG